MADSHMDGPLIVDDGIRIGTQSTNTEVINSSGNLANTGMIANSSMFTAGVVDTSALGTNSVTTVKITDSNVTHAKLAEEAGFENTLSLYSDSTAIAIGNPVYISGYSTKGAMSVTLAEADNITKAAQFIAVSAATAADEAVTVAPVATVAYDSTEAVGTILYLSSTAGGLTATPAATKGTFKQPIAVVTVQHSTAVQGYIKAFPGYSKAVATDTTT